MKLPVTAAGLDVMEDCVARARQTQAGPGGRGGRCFAVIMIGRLDDYLREVVRDNGLDIPEPHVVQAGLAVTRRAYALYRKLEIRPTLLVAALRGTHHLTELAGAELVMSIHPKYQSAFDAEQLPKVPRIDAEVPGESIQPLARCPEFVRAYEPEGMQSREFISFGLTQRTLSQFSEIGWKQIERLAAELR